MGVLKFLSSKGCQIPKEVQKILGYLEQGYQFSWGAIFPVTPGCELSADTEKPMDNKISHVRQYIVFRSIPQYTEGTLRQPISAAFIHRGVH